MPRAPNIPLALFNSLGRELQVFEPQAPHRARLYSCGLTVYNYAHIGNLRAYTFADRLRTSSTSSTSRTSVT